MTDPKKLISIKYIADASGVTRTTVTRDIKAGKLKAQRIQVQPLPDQPEQVWLGVEPAEAERYIAARAAKGETRGRKKATPQS